MWSIASCANFLYSVRSNEVIFALTSNDRTELHVFNNATRETVSTRRVAFAAHSS